MQSLAVIFACMAAVSALDIRLFEGRDCKGGTFTCTNVNPNSCCGIPSGGVSSVGFYGILPQWNIECRGHENGRCANTKTIQVAFNTNFKCLNDGPYTGGGYGFRANKARGLGLDKQTSGEQQMPDRFETADGRKYNLAALDTDQLVEFIDQTANGTSLEAYKALEVME
ncbi:hypothetical protein BT63DRAFT_472947 [Microthyrium microscopicum]|uniref:Uncharacterized protein n=1 Tax=Microthyrium microscopicum TaxID=703497 RepID=A0A6A6U4Z0_9PEZI|nr:hypothetical protein BT63DRAFT_472947 [Microthyrium microscopicum]